MLPGNEVEVAVVEDQHDEARVFPALPVLLMGALRELKLMPETSIKA